jgi:hypothetical protein
MGRNSVLKSFHAGETEREEIVMDSTHTIEIGMLVLFFTTCSNLLFQIINVRRLYKQDVLTDKRGVCEDCRDRTRMAVKSEGLKEECRNLNTGLKDMRSKTEALGNRVTKMEQQLKMKGERRNED